MQKRLDLFKIHSDEDTPGDWIWVNFTPNILKLIYFQLLRSKTQKDIATELSLSLKSGRSTVEKHLIKLKRSKTELWLPLPIIIELINITNPRLKNQVVSSFNYFICKNNVKKEKIKAINLLDNKLAEIIGAHIADGYLKKEGNTYRIKIVDERKDQIIYISNLIEGLFSIKPIVKYSENDNCWICNFNSKIIGRYFENIFDIKSGKKAKIANEPNLIKNSDFKIRKAFAKGVIMFDGGVKTSGTVAISSMSKNLIDDLYDILTKDAISINKKYNLKKESWLIESKSGRNKIYLKKWLPYFEPRTWKYNRLNFFINPKKQTIRELIALFPEHYSSKISLNDVYSAIQELKISKIKTILYRLDEKNLKVSNTTIYKYLYLLEKSELIEKYGEKVTIGKNSWSETNYALV